MNPRSIPLLPLLRAAVSAAKLLAVLGAFTLVQAGDFVVVSAQAIPQYARPKAANGTVQPQSYAFTQGKYFGGAVKDRSLEQAAFRSIVETLAPSLARQSFFPATNPTAADLLIVVHWGTTQTYDDPNRELRIDQLNSALGEYRAGADEAGNNDPGRLNEIGGDMAAGASLQQAYADRNADLLGYRRSLRERSQRGIASPEEITMRHELNEERYFLILMAYDYDVLRKEKRRHLLWTTHMSVRAAGSNFRIALPQLSLAASEFFGVDRLHPKHIEVNEREGRVDIGEATVVPEEPPPQK